MRDFRKLQVWEKAHQMTLAVYKVTARFPRAEVYGLVSQMRRAAVSIPANIAEGCGREGGAELGRYLKIAMGSASELEYELLLAHELGFIGPEGHHQLSRQGLRP
jgi:four helix bundle protein